jgi:glutaminyl-peptide cyclotransferase
MPLPHRILGVTFALLLIGTACRSSNDAAPTETIPPSPGVAQLTVEIYTTIAHETEAFTQGLVFADGDLYESTGRYGRSQLLQVAPDNGDVLRSADLDAELFGEGLAHVDGRLIQLTWKAGRALVYDLATLTVVDELTYEGEGWGLCHDGDRLVMSDGSSRLTFRDPATFDVNGTVEVTNGGAPLSALNELECVDGAVYANIWRTDQIVRIDPSTGRVDAVIEAGSLDRPASAGVLNGIAHDPETDRFRLTGKNWPAAYEVEFVELT